MEPENQFVMESKNIQESLIDFFDDADDVTIENLFSKSNRCEDQPKLKQLLHIILNISNNHHRTSTFFDKIEQILKFHKNNILNYFSNLEIFTIFKSNKRILLFLIKEKMVSIDKYIATVMLNEKYSNFYYPLYFITEIKNFFNEELFKEIYNKNGVEIDNENYINKLINNEAINSIDEQSFESKRFKGENDLYICELIRNDSVQEFIKYINNNQISLLSQIKPSIFETNNFLLKKKTTSLIEYAAFYGSIQILKFLNDNQVELNPSLWIYAIHGQNPDMIHFLERNQVKLDNKTYKQCIIECIKCHHNDFVKYFYDNYVNPSKSDLYDYSKSCLKYHNFCLIEDDFINQSSFDYLCKYDYISLVEFYLKSKFYDFNKINYKKVFYIFILMKFQIIHK